MTRAGSTASTEPARPSTEEDRELVATLPASATDEALRLPLIYALFILITASLATLLFRARDR